MVWNGITIQLAAPPDPTGKSYTTTLPGYVNTRRRYEQWDVCVRCGIERPMSDLNMQLGLLLCSKGCLDDLTIQRRPAMIGRTLGQGPQEEGADRRFEDRANYFGQDLEVF